MPFPTPVLPPVLPVLFGCNLSWNAYGLPLKSTIRDQGSGDQGTTDQGNEGTRERGKSRGRFLVERSRHPRAGCAGSRAVGLAEIMHGTIMLENREITGRYEVLCFLADASLPAWQLLALAGGRSSVHRRRFIARMVAACLFPGISWFRVKVRFDRERRSRPLRSQNRDLGRPATLLFAGCVCIDWPY